MIKDIALTMVFGFPLVMYGGLFTLACFLFTAYIAMANMKGNMTIKPKWHPRMAKISFTLALIHAIAAVAIFW